MAEKSRVDNLKGSQGRRFETGQKQREIARQGGIASGQAKRAKKTIGDFVVQMVNSDASEANKKKMAALGIQDEEVTNAACIAAMVFQQALKGDMKAVEKIEQYEAKGSEDDKVYEIPARVLGSAFVDINRRIEPNKAYILKGGRGGLKSSFISLKIPELMKNNPLIHACVVRKVGNTLKDSVYAQMKWALKELGLEDEFEFKTSPLEIRYKKTGQTIYFRGADDPMKLKSIKPPFGYIGILWIEEEDQLSGPEEERNIKQSVLRGNGTEFYDFVSYNPPKSKDNWVNKRLLEPDPNRVVHSSTYLQAPEEWLGPKFIEDAEHLKEVNPSAYEHEYLGVPNGEGGNVFENIEIREITDEEISTFDVIFQGLDWGWYPDPVAFVRCHYDRERETIYLIDEYGGCKIKSPVIAEELLKREYDDFDITCDSADKRSTLDLKDLGLRAKLALKGPGSVEYGMKWLQIRKIVIDPRRTPEAYNEIVNYEYERDKEGNVISGYPDANNHYIDALRYALEKYSNKRGNLA